MPQRSGGGVATLQCFQQGTLCSAAMFLTVQSFIWFVRYFFVYGMNNTIIYIVYIINKHSEQLGSPMGAEEPIAVHSRL